MKKIYFAGPWFSAEQDERHNRIYELIKRLNKFDIFNPKLSSNITNQQDCDLFSIILKTNIDNIVDADLIVAITDGKDMGTIWETGFAYANKKPIVYYCETIGTKPFNLMLAKTGLTAKSENELIDILQRDNIFNWQESYTYQGVIE